MEDTEMEKIEIDFDEGMATAEAVNFCNDLFDSVNGNEMKDNELRCVTTENSAHHEFWTNAKGILKNMSFVNKVTREKMSVLILRNWLFTINGFEKLWSILNSKYGFKNLKTRYCNQDSLENLFGQIRSHGVRNVNPTSRQFHDSFATLLLNNMKSVSIGTGNCEITEHPLLTSLEKYLEKDAENVEVNVTYCDSDDDEPHDIISNTNIDVESSSEFLSAHLEDIIIAILKQLNNCQICCKSLRNSKFPILAKQIICRINKLLETRCHRNNIMKVILQHFEEWLVNIDWHKCAVHHDDIFNVILRVIVHKTLIWWCKKINISFYATDNIDYNLSCIEDIKKIKKARAIYNEGRCKRKLMLNEYRQSVKQNETIM